MENSAGIAGRLKEEKTKKDGCSRRSNGKKFADDAQDDSPSLALGSLSSPLA